MIPLLLLITFSSILSNINSYILVPPVFRRVFQPQLAPTKAEVIAQQPRQVQQKPSNAGVVSQEVQSKLNAIRWKAFDLITTHVNKWKAFYMIPTHANQAESVKNQTETFKPAKSAVFGESDYTLNPSSNETKLGLNTNLLINQQQQQQQLAAAGSYGSAGSLVAQQQQQLAAAARGYGSAVPDSQNLNGQEQIQQIVVSNHGVGIAAAQEQNQESFSLYGQQSYLNEAQLQ